MAKWEYVKGAKKIPRKAANLCIMFSNLLYFNNIIVEYRKGM